MKQSPYPTSAIVWGMLFVFVCLSQRLAAQQLTISVTPVYGSYSMSELKSLQQEQSRTISDSLYTDLKTVYDFPSYWGIRVSASYLLGKRSKFSLRGGGNATGGRVHYSDYSGVVRIDKTVRSTNLGVSYSFLFINTAKFQVGAGLGLDMSYSILHTENTVEIYITKEKTTETNSYKSNQVLVSPEVSIVYFPLRNLFLELGAGFASQVSTSAVTNTSNGKVGPLNKASHPVGLDWSGTRLNAGIGYRINLKK